MKEIIINGKMYVMWSQFVKRKNEWIGGQLKDIGDSMDRRLGCGVVETEITNIKLEPNGDDSAWFEVSGKEFNCGFDTQCCGIQELGKDWIVFSGYGGHTWGIKQKGD